MDIPVPILFNCWKHHAGFIKQEIVNKDFQLLLSEITIIGDVLMDLYLGSIGPEHISLSILAQIKPAINKAEYSEWLYEEGKDFRMLEIDDGSRWILRMGEESNRYIHVHPARYSPHSLRVKAPTLKTSVAVSAWAALHNQQINLALINHIRKDFLNLSPVKDDKSVPALNRLIKLFTSSDLPDS